MKCRPTDRFAAGSPASTTPAPSWRMTSRRRPIRRCAGRCEDAEPRSRPTSTTDRTRPPETTLLSGCPLPRHPAGTYVVADLLEVPLVHRHFEAVLLDRRWRGGGCGGNSRRGGRRRGRQGRPAVLGAGQRGLGDRDIELEAHVAIWLLAEQAGAEVAGVPVAGGEEPGVAGLPGPAGGRAEEAPLEEAQDRRVIVP